MYGIQLLSSVTDIYERSTAIDPLLLAVPLPIVAIDASAPTINADVAAAWAALGRLGGARAARVRDARAPAQLGLETERGERERSPCIVALAGAARVVPPTAKDRSMDGALWTLNMLCLLVRAGGSTKPGHSADRGCLGGGLGTLAAHGQHAMYAML